MARISDAAQGQLPRCGLDPRGATRSRPAALYRPGPAGRYARRPGVVVLLLQVAAVRAGRLPRARPVHPADQAQEHPAVPGRRGAHHPPWARVLRLLLLKGRSPFAPFTAELLSVV